MATIIDSLLVTLGLDSSNFKKGAQQADKVGSESARKAKQNAEEISKAFTELGRNITGLFLGFESASGFAKWLGNLNAAEADLGRTAKNVGLSSHELNKWGTAVKLAGGDAADAQQAFGQLAKEFVQLTTNPQAGVGPLLALSRRFGVLTTVNGKLRDQGEILEDLADRTEHLGAAYQHVLFTGTGLSEKEANYLELSHAKRQELLKQAEEANRVTEKSVADAQELQQRWRQIGAEATAFGQSVLKIVTPAVEGLFTVLGGVGAAVSQMTDDFATFGHAVGSLINGVAKGDVKGASKNFVKEIAAADDMTYTVDDQGNVVPSMKEKPQPKTPTATNIPATPQSRSLRNNNPGNLKYAGQPGATGADAQGFAIFASPTAGAAALDAQLNRYAGRGINNIAGIVETYEGKDAPGNHNNIQAYEAFLAKFVGKGTGDQLTDADRRRVAEGIAQYEARRKEGAAAAALVANSRAARFASNVGPTPGASSGVRAAAAAAGSGNTTTVTIEQMQVNAPNADPIAVANQAAAAIQRKLTTSQGVVAQS